MFQGGDQPPNTYEFLNEITNNPCLDEGFKSDRIGCTKFNEGCTKFNEGCTKFNEECTKFNEECTKFCEECTKGFKMRSEVGISPQSLLYELLNEIMDHPCSDGGPGSNRIGCTKFNEGCTKICEGCTKGSKLCFEVGIGPQSFPYGFQNEIMDHPCSDGGPGSNRIGCTKFNEECTKFVKHVPNP